MPDRSAASPTRRRSPSPRLPSSLLIAWLLTALFSTLAVVELYKIADSHRRAESLLSDVETTAYALRATDMESLPEDQLDYALIDRSVAYNGRMDATLAEFMETSGDSGRISEIRLDYLTYFVHFQAKLHAIQSGNRAQAMSIGLVWVDPSFATLIGEVESTSKEYSRSARTIIELANIAIVSVLVVTGVFEAWLFRRNEAAYLQVVATEKETLRRSEERYQAMLRYSSDVVLIIDKTWQVKYVSPACQRLWGYDDGNLMSDNFAKVLDTYDLEEDNQVNQRLAARLLEKRGHRVDIVENGQEAVAAAARTRYDIILMDVQMPEMDGFEATAAIRLSDQSLNRDTPIVAMTAHAMAGDRERCLAGGMNGYVSKPLSVSGLVHEISATTGSLIAAHGQPSGA